MRPETGTLESDTAGQRRTLPVTFAAARTVLTLLRPPKPDTRAPTNSVSQTLQ
jgi:hypothetical protein